MTRETRADGTGGIVARERWKSFARAREERERGRGGVEDERGRDGGGETRGAGIRDDERA